MSEQVKANHNNSLGSMRMAETIGEMLVAGAQAHRDRAELIRANEAQVEVIIDLQEKQKKHAQEMQARDENEAALMKQIGDLKERLGASMNAEDEQLEAGGPDDVSEADNGEGILQSDE